MTVMTNKFALWYMDRAEAPEVLISKWDLIRTLIIVRLL